MTPLGEADEGPGEWPKLLHSPRRCPYQGAASIEISLRTVVRLMRRERAIEEIEFPSELRSRGLVQSASRYMLRSLARLKQILDTGSALDG